MEPATRRGASCHRMHAGGGQNPSDAAGGRRLRGLGVGPVRVTLKEAPPDHWCLVHVHGLPGANSARPERTH